MGLGDSTRINTNLQALNAFSQLQKTNAKLSDHQLRLSTGSRINKAEDDSAGYTISKKLEAKVRGQAQALSNIGDAKSMLTVAEGSLNTAMNILQTMKEKTVQAANDSMGAEERAAIHGQLSALQKELDDTFGTATFNGKDLFTGDGTAFTFQVNAESGDTFDVEIGGMSGEKLGVGNADAGFGATTYAEPDALSNLAITGAAGATTNARYDIEIVSFETPNVTYKINGTATGPVDIATLDAVPLGDGVTIDLNDAANLEAGKLTVFVDQLAVDVGDAAKAGSAIAAVDSAISSISKELANLGDSQSRLTFKQENLQTSMNNYEAAKSRITDADFAKEQMEIVKLQILQQTGTASLAQANVAPQAVLSLIGGQ